MTPSTTHPIGGLHYCLTPTPTSTSTTPSPPHPSSQVGSTLADPYLAYAGGLNALAGPLHGLANQEVLGWILDLQKKFKAEVGAWGSWGCGCWPTDCLVGWCLPD